MLCFLDNVSNINIQLNCKLYPIPKIEEMLLKIEVFKFSTSLDLGMGYYYIILTYNVRDFCMIIIPLEKYNYKQLPTG